MKRAIAIGLFLAGGQLTGGCATLTGLATGAFTGAVDAPAEVYRAHREGLDEHPIYWTLNIAVFVPLGMGFGPVVGFCKGVALDVQWALRQRDYGPVFGSLGDESIWRPYSIRW